MLSITMIALSFVAVGPTPVTPIQPVADIIEIRSGMIRPADQIRRDQVRFNSNEITPVVATIDNGVLSWSNSGTERERLGGQDAPELILVRAFDAVFAIDPFAPLPAGGTALMRQLTRGTSLEVDRTLFNRQSIDRTEELMRLLERSRHNWLQDNGYFGTRTYTNPAAGQGEAAKAAPEPAGWFRIPEDMPRTRSREQVLAEPAADRTAAIAAGLFSGDEPVRISLPFGTAPDVVASAERRNVRTVAGR